jgi:integrase
MTRRAYAKRGERPAKKDALTREPLLAMVETCENTLLGKRDRALLLFAWASGGRRRSEVALADMKFLSVQADGSYVYELVHSKTNQSGASHASNHKPVTGSAAMALKNWLQSARIVQGPVFRRVLRGGHVGGPLSPAAVRDIVKKRAELAGLDGGFSAHSLRSGFVTEATARGVPLAEMMAMTGHQSVQSLVGYARPVSKVAKDLLDAKIEPGSEQK